MTAEKSWPLYSLQQQPDCEKLVRGEKLLQTIQLYWPGAVCLWGVLNTLQTHKIHCRYPWALLRLLFGVDLNECSAAEMNGAKTRKSFVVSGAGFVKFYFSPGTIVWVLGLLCQEHDSPCEFHIWEKGNCCCLHLATQPLFLENQQN